MSFHIRGVWAASLTPLHVDLSIDHARLAKHVRWLLNSGCHGVAVFGSTGEANSFSVAERTWAVRSLASAGIPMDRVLVGAGACAVPDAAALCSCALETRAAGVLLHPPFYYKNVSDDGLFAFHAHLVRAVADPGLRIVLYHFPKLAVVGYSKALIERLVLAYPSVFVGLKDSSGDLERMGAIARDLPDFAVLAGTERLLSLALDAGGAGCLTASANVTSALARRVYDEPDGARRMVLQAALTGFRTGLEAAPFAAGLKAIMASKTGDDSWLRLRAPLEPLGRDAESLLHGALAALPTLPNFDDH